jgi:hypothetical protein
MRNVASAQKWENEIGEVRWQPKFTLAGADWYLYGSGPKKNRAWLLVTPDKAARENRAPTLFFNEAAAISVASKELGLRDAAEVVKEVKRRRTFKPVS